MFLCSFPMSRLKGMQFVFISHSGKVCSCHVICFSWRVQSPNLSVSFKTARKSVVVLKVSTFVLFRCFISLFFGLAFCMHCRVIDSPFHCLEFHQPDLTCLYTQWHTVSKVSPHTVFLRFSRQDCHCWFVPLQWENHSAVWFTFIIFSPAVIPRPDFLHSRRDYWVHRVEAGAGAFVSLEIIFHPWYGVKEILHPEMKIQSFTHPHVVLWNAKGAFI